LVPEIFSAATGWTALPDLTTWSAVPEDSTRRVPLYAQMFLLRDGRLFYSGGQYGGNEGLNPCLLDLGARSITEVPGLVGHEEQSHRNQAASVLLPPAQDQRVMLIGGGAADPAAHETHETTEAIDNVNIVDLAAGQPQYRATAPLQRARMHHNAILLPDRTVLVAGGSRMDESRVAATLVAEIYDPSGETWTPAAAARVPRLYHSTVVLLPDGTVITAGSNPTRGDEELRLELFHPPACCMEDWKAKKTRSSADIYATRTEFGRPRSSIRLRTSTAMAISVAWASAVWKRSIGPMTCLKRPIWPSTKALRL
jgi:hypothetical protein